MPLASTTAAANLALDLIGEPYLTALDSDSGVTADCVRLHFSQTLETVLEGHVWSFATRCSQLTEAGLAETFAAATLNPTGEDNEILLTALTAGPSGNEISVKLTASATLVDTTLTVSGNAIEITFFPKRLMRVTGELMDGPDPWEFPDFIYYGQTNGKKAYSESGLISGDNGLVWGTSPARFEMTGSFIGSYWTSSDAVATPDLATNWVPQGAGIGTPMVMDVTLSASEVITLINEDPSASLLVLAENAEGSDGSGQVAAVALTPLTGGSSVSNVYAPAYGSAFHLPEDCLRLIKIDGEDIDAPRTRFEIQGRYLLLEETLAEAPVIHYITNVPPVTEWPTTFVDAFVALLASKIAPKLCQNPAMANDLLQKHEIALGKARSKDARETRSGENHGPRQLAARSGLVQARFGGRRPIILAEPPES